MKTIKQIADEVGVSKQRVDRLFKRSGINAVASENQKYLYDTAALEFAINHFLKTASQTALQTALPMRETALFDAVLKQLEVKDRQIEALTVALHAEQQLHADTKKMLSAPEAKTSVSSMNFWQRVRFVVKKVP